MSIKIGNITINNMNINGYKTHAKDGKYKIEKPNGEFIEYETKADFEADFWKINRGEKI